MRTIVLVLSLLIVGCAGVPETSTIAPPADPPQMQVAPSPPAPTSTSSPDARAASPPATAGPDAGAPMAPEAAPAPPPPPFPGVCDPRMGTAQCDGTKLIDQDTPATCVWQCDNVLERSATATGKAVCFAPRPQVFAQLGQPCSPDYVEATPDVGGGGWLGPYACAPGLGCYVDYRSSVEPPPSTCRKYCASDADCGGTACVHADLPCTSWRSQFYGVANAPVPDIGLCALK